MKKGGYGVVYQDVMRNPNLPVEAKAIYAYLSSIAGIGNVCYPSVETMQRDLCVGKNRLMKYMSQLISAGVVERTRERNGNIYGRNIYKVTHEAEVINDLKRIFEAVESRAVDFQAIDNKANNNNKSNINKLNNNSSIICPEPVQPSPDPSGILLPLIDGTDYDVPLSKIEKWSSAYPAVDVRQQLQRMIAWLDANPKRRKTRRGIDRFINTWLSRDQDKGGTFRSGTSQQQASESISYDLPPEYQEMYKNLGKNPPAFDDPFQ